MKALSPALFSSLLLLSCASTTATTSKPTQATNSMTAPASAPADPLVRERVEVVIAGVTERWSLRWNKPPEPYCALPSDAMICPCLGFEYGESGSLSLLRERPGVETEALLLDPFFSDGAPSRSSILPKYLFVGSDLERDDEDIKDILSTRPIVPIMVLEDYNHDGLAAEFVLQVGAGPCDHQQGVLVGVDGKGGPIKVFGSVANPGQFIVMELYGWFKLLEESSAELTQLLCGDHGSEEEQVLHVSVKDGAFSVQQEIFDCNEADSTRGQSISKREL